MQIKVITDLWAKLKSRLQEHKSARSVSVISGYEEKHKNFSQLTSVNNLGPIL